MYPLGSLTAELQSASRRRLDIFQMPNSKAAGEDRPQGAELNPPFDAQAKQNGHCAIRGDLIALKR
jgi:hypothetical protein